MRRRCQQIVSERARLAASICQALGQSLAGRSGQGDAAGVKRQGDLAMAMKVSKELAKMDEAELEQLELAKEESFSFDPPAGWEDWILGFPSDLRNITPPLLSLPAHQLIWAHLTIGRRHGRRSLSETRPCYL